MAVKVRRIEMKATTNGILALVFLSAAAMQPLYAQDAIHVDVTGNVGMGTNTPLVQLDVVGNDPATGTDNTTALYVTNNSESVGGRVILGLENNGTARFSVENTSIANGRWVFAVGNSSSFRISKADTEVVEFEVTAAGDVNAQGTFNTLSDRNSKMDIESLNSNEILDKVLSLSLSSWSYKDEPGVSHIGPMAQDFYSAFELGSNHKSIAGIDISGVALAAIQGLYMKLEEKEARIQELESKIQEQQLMVARIEALEEIAVKMMLEENSPTLTNTAFKNN